MVLEVVPTSTTFEYWSSLIETLNTIMSHEIWQWIIILFLSSLLNVNKFKD